MSEKNELYVQQTFLFDCLFVKETPNNSFSRNNLSFMCSVL